MQRTNVNSIQNQCKNMYNESCIENCIQWELEARINANNENLIYVRNFIDYY